MENFELTAAEASIAADAELLRMKNRVMVKAVQLMGVIQEGLAGHAAHQRFPFEAEWLGRHAKISKGEQYKGLPWVMLDYPRFFSNSDAFAFRTMFWWGHYFSSTLHLAGRVKAMFSNVLIRNHAVLASNGFQVYLGDDPWEHDFEGGNYRPIGSISLEDWSVIINRHDFLKIAKPYSLAHWGKVSREVVAAYAALLALLDTKAG
ncbi:hypothetical protein [Chitinophaga sp. Cy-1792]|uniref:hypothetical protein n=1 Tax=Chitinophaga sp. Cy-1792 TaxID=2608339 RepID=UPI00141DDE0A|nr:hypothetical protein [Chitinophaga sp. Cy-1792]NIG51892.1 hypothetical protein [Chitinophaga sp. Cy-1792]